MFYEQNLKKIGLAAKRIQFIIGFQTGCRVHSLGVLRCFENLRRFFNYLFKLYILAKRDF